MKLFVIYILTLALLHNQALAQLSKINQKENDSLDVIRIQNNASELFDKGDFSAFDSINKAINVSKKNGYVQGSISSYILLGQFQQNLGKYDLAYKSFLSAFDFSKKNNLQKELALTYDEIGSNFYFQEDYGNALNNFFKALEINKKIDNRDWICVNYNNIGLTYMVLEKEEKALNFLKMAAKVNLDNKNLTSLANNYGGIAMFFEQNQQSDSALYYYNLRLNLYNQTQNHMGICITYWLIGDTYLSINKDSAFHYIVKSKKMADSLQYTSIIQSTSEKLSELYAEKKDFISAYHYLQIHKKITDSIEKASMNKQIAIVEMEYKYSMHEQELVFKNQKRKTQIILLIISNILLILFTVLIFNRQRIKLKNKIIQNEKLELEKKILAQKIEFKNKEITTNLIIQAKKNEQINQILQKLENKDKQSENIDIIPETVKNLTKIQDNKIWQDFEISFKQVHISFYDNLYKEFPDLSRNEKRLCAFLKLNMSTKDISEITKQSIKSINVARTRLRRKLNLNDGDISLNQFLSRF